MFLNTFKTLSLGLLLGLLSNASPLHAQSTTQNIEAVSLLATGSIRLEPGETRSISIDGFRHIQKLHIEAWGVRNEAMFEILVNGEVKGTIFVPARDPEYVVTIAEATRSIQLRHKTGATVAIENIIAHQSTQRARDPQNEFSTGAFVDRSFAAAISRDVINQIDRLSDQTKYTDAALYLIPIKVAAGRTWSMAQARGDSSQRVAQQLTILLGQMHFASPFVESLLRDSALFEDAVALLALQERLEAALR